MTTEIETKELAVLKGQVSKLETRANEVTIKTQEDYEGAADIIAKLKDTGSIIKKKKESITKPLNEALKNARELFKPIENQFVEAEKTIKGKLLTYKREADERARIEEEKIASRVTKGTMRMDTAAEKIDNVERVKTTTRGKVGKVQVKKIPKLRIVDKKLIPLEYLEPDMGAIRRDAINNKITIPGVEVYYEETIAAGSI